jgi:hypothetical protein
MLSGNFRSRVFRRLVRRAFGPGRSLTPHVLRHTFASLHLARGTNLKWVQEAGGWASAKMLLDVYGHFMPTETRGFADAITTPNGPQTAPVPLPDTVERRVPSRNILYQQEKTGADGRTRTADLLITNWFHLGSTDVHRRPGTYTGQGVGPAGDSTGVHRASGRPPPLLSRLLSKSLSEAGAFLSHAIPDARHDREPGAERFEFECKAPGAGRMSIRERQEKVASWRGCTESHPIYLLRNASVEDYPKGGVRGAQISLGNSGTFLLRIAISERRTFRTPQQID